MGTDLYMTAKASPGDPAQPANKYTKIMEALTAAIQTGKYKPGQKLPSEAQLSRTFVTSRLTVARALNELEAAGTLVRRPGSGSYVNPARNGKARTFGLLIPELGETEIFEPICQGMARFSRATHDELLWGAATRGVDSHEHQALELCEHYIAKDVAGIFFAPLEYVRDNGSVNRQILESFKKAGIPVVLLDRDVCQYPERSHCDLVGIDNERAGHMVTNHLTGRGCRRVIFVAAPYSAPTVERRAAGYAAAASAAGCETIVEVGETKDTAWLRSLVERYDPDGFVCANDRTAGELMLCLNELGIDIPAKIKIVGIDDVKYAGLLHVPLTTLRQPCHDIGAAAFATMIERIEHPAMPPQQRLLECELIVRRSSGARHT
jgi:GntR family transcriptional regulator, arabinose operon transcriptional repressor